MGLTFSRGGGVQLFPGGGGGGVLVIIFKETHITCDFLGGPDPTSPLPLWIRTCKIQLFVREICTLTHAYSVL